MSKDAAKMARKKSLKQYEEKTLSGTWLKKELSSPSSGWHCKVCSRITFCNSVFCGQKYSCVARNFIIVLTSSLFCWSYHLVTDRAVEVLKLWTEIIHWAGCESMLIKSVNWISLPLSIDEWSRTFCFVFLFSATREAPPNVTKQKKKAPQYKGQKKSKALLHFQPTLLLTSPFFSLATVRGGKACPSGCPSCSALGLIWLRVEWRWH